MISRIRAHAGRLYAVGKLFANAKRFEDAIPHLRDSLKAAPEFDLAREKLAESLVFSNRFDEAVSEYRTLIKRSPQKAYLRRFLGSALLAGGNETAAVAAFDEAIKRKSDYWEARFGRARALAKLNRTREAIAELKIVSATEARSGGRPAGTDSTPERSAIVTRAVLPAAP